MSGTLSWSESKNNFIMSHGIWIIVGFIVGRIVAASVSIMLVLAVHENGHRAPILRFIQHNLAKRIVSWTITQRTMRRKQMWTNVAETFLWKKKEKQQESRNRKFLFSISIYIHLNRRRGQRNKQEEWKRRKKKTWNSPLQRGNGHPSLCVGNGERETVECPRVLSWRFEPAPVCDGANWLAAWMWGGVRTEEKGIKKRKRKEKKRKGNSLAQLSKRGRGRGEEEEERGSRKPSKEQQNHTRAAPAVQQEQAAGASSKRQQQEPAAARASSSKEPAAARASPMDKKAH